MPSIGPRSTPNTSAESSTLPAAVDAGVRAVAVAVTGRVVRLGGGARRVRQVGRRGTAAPPISLLLQTNDVGRRRQRVVAEVAGARRAVGLGRRGAEVALVGEGRVLRPGAGVEHADDDARAGVARAAEVGVDAVGADELGARVGERLRAARRCCTATTPAIASTSATLLAGTSAADAAVDGAQALADLRRSGDRGAGRRGRRPPASTT